MSRCCPWFVTSCPISSYGFREWKWEWGHFMPLSLAALWMANETEESSEVGVYYTSLSFSGHQSTWRLHLPSRTLGATSMAAGGSTASLGKSGHNAPVAHRWLGHWMWSRLRNPSSRGATVEMDADKEEEEVVVVAVEEVRLWSCKVLSLMCWMKRFLSSSGIWPFWARTMQVGRCRLSM